MKICTIVGARPQFIKAAALSRVLRENFDEILIHTGQHYDYNMSDLFFEELDIPKPNYNLNISGGSHGSMTGKMLISIEDVFIKEKPDMVLVYGDTNSTLAGALAAVKLHTPICHVEAGVRMKTLKNPEEVNRVLVDRISQLMMCCTEPDVENLAKEGITNGVFNTGDLMYDAVLYYSQNLAKPKESDTLNFDNFPVALPENYYLLTCHREENTKDENALKEILEAMNSLEYPTIYPVHPRNKNVAQKLCLENNFKNIILIQPVGYLTSLYLIKNAVKIVTDSGGLQREAWFLKKQCITLLDTPPWPITLEGNVNQLCSPNKEEIIKKLNVSPDYSKIAGQFGDGNSAKKITDIISTYLKEV